MLFPNHCEVQPKDLRDTLIHLNKHAESIDWGQSGTNLQNGLRLCFETLNDNLAGIYPKEYSGLRQYQIDKAGITFDNETEQLQKIADIINTQTTNDSQ